MTDVRIEQDSLGPVQVPADALWGAQTQRAVDNFPVWGPMPNAFIRALARVKWVAAQVNQDLGLLQAEQGEAIRQAAAQIIAGEHADAFPVDVFQTGSGTSSNMNMNEVIAHLCARAGVSVHPNDHVNLGQSSNDSIPTALHVSAVVAVTEVLQPQVERLLQVLADRAGELADVVKTGRTHLMDAMPVTLGQELNGWQSQLRFALGQLLQARDGLLSIPQGGTAVGTGINAHEEFARRFATVLSEQTAQAFVPLDTPFAGMGALDRPLALSSALRNLAAVLMKVANDLRWMNSGPIHGLAEIQLPAVQPGSSIMPGKVNPVICESTCMAAAQVMGLDQANLIGVQSGNFQLNVMMPLVASNLLAMVKLLSSVIAILNDKAIAGFTVNREHLLATVGRNPILVTALNPVIGYEKAAAIAKAAFASGRSVLDVAEEHTGLPREELARYLDPVPLTRGGIQGG